MTDTLAPIRRDDKERKPSGGLFRAFWRWHFYAAFIVAPILLVLASTGLVYLLRFQIEPLMHADAMKVEQSAGVTKEVPYEDQRAAVAKAYPKATITSMTEPRAEDRSTDFYLSLPDGSSRDAYVDPWTGEVLGDLNPDTTLSGLAVRLHTNVMLGSTGDVLMELGACWAIVMALTGYYLFIRGRAARLRRKLTGTAGSAMRSRHAVIGSVVGASLLILLISGLPWTAFWGKHAQTMATDHSSSMWGSDPGGVSHKGSTLDESLPHSHAHEIPWAQGDSKVPQSGKPGKEASIATIDTAVAVADRAGLHHPLTIALPGDDKGVFSAIGYAFHDPSREKTVHIDQYGGQVVGTYGFADYPALAKIVSQGIGLHEGRSFGPVSFWAAAVSCLMVIFMCVSGPMMWWRRRPKSAGSVAAPRGRMPLRSSPLLAVAIVALGVFLPFFGITLLVALLVDQLILRRVPRLQTWFNVV